MEESAGILTILLPNAICLGDALSPWLRWCAASIRIGFESMIFDTRWSTAMFWGIMFFLADISCHTETEILTAFVINVVKRTPAL